MPLQETNMAWFGGSCEQPVLHPVDTWSVRCYPTPQHRMRAWEESADLCVAGKISGNKGRHGLSI